jgi:Polyketide synthesis cyclase
MSRTLIVARIRPGAEPEVGRNFATSDASDLPAESACRSGASTRCTTSGER